MTRSHQNGHFERFSRKLEIMCREKTVKRSIVPYLLKAAVVTLAGYPVITLDMGSFHQIRQKQDDTRRCITPIQRG